MELRATTLAMFVASALCVDAAAAADLLEVYERARTRDPQFLEAARVLAQNVSGMQLELAALLGGGER